MLVYLIKKRYTINSEVKRIGGPAERILLRHIRKETIVGEKRKVASSMLIDWQSGEIKTPASSEKEEFEAMVRRNDKSTLSWGKIHGIQKKYWDERNIYS